MNKSLIAIFGFFLATAANAQLGDLINSVKSVIDVAQQQKNVSSKNQPLNSTQSQKGSSTTSSVVSEKQSGLATKRNICDEQEWDTVFQCTIKNEPLTYCQHIESDIRIIELNGKINGKEISATTFEGEKSPPIKIQSIYEKPVTYDSVYFESEGNTFALTRCNGMCALPPWFTVYKGNKKLLVASCDDDSVIDNFDTQYKVDNRGKIVKNKLYQEKSSKLNFDSP